VDFPETPDDLNKICIGEGMRIFNELRLKYFENTTADLDVVLNSLCFALLCLRATHTNKEHYSNFNTLVKQILDKNGKG